MIIYDSECVVLMELEVKVLKDVLLSMNKDCVCVVLMNKVR